MSPRAAVHLFAGLVLLVSCSDDGIQGARDAGLGHLSSKDAGNTGSIGATGGTFSFYNGKVKLEVPIGALDKEITVKVLRAKSYPQAPGLVPGTVYDLLPEGTVFKNRSS